MKVRLYFILCFLLSVNFGLTLAAQTCTYNAGSQSFTGTCAAGTFTNLVLPNNSGAVDLSTDPRFLDLTGVTISLGSNCDITFSANTAVDNSTSFDFDAATTDLIIRFGNGTDVTFSKNSDPSLDDLNDQLALCSGDCTLGDITNILPVELVFFNVRAVGPTALIRWETASETDNDYFTLERSANGRDWVALGRITGAGNSSVNRSYEQSDTAPLGGRSYYRLKQTDFDGTSAYSDVVSFDWETSVSVTIFPNPTTDWVTVNTESAFSIYNANGKQIINRKIQKSGVSRIDLSALKPGLYLLRSGDTTLRILKQ